ncbi:MAG: uracil-DNA glycosylase [Planctomycetota bacterium]|jgi:uracil-DNA glycosylase
MASFTELLRDVRACRVCEQDLPEGPRPVLQCSPQSRILIAGQAPGSKVHQSGIPFDDASGKRLRDWLGIDSEVFYDADKIAILPMGFCYPGTSASGDLPPRPECAANWRQLLLEKLENIELTLVLGQYAQQFHLGKTSKGKNGQTLTELVKDWPKFWPHLIPLPHPSPRNNRWLKLNPWFELELLPEVKILVQKILQAGTS